MSRSEAINGSEDFSRRHVVDLKTPPPPLWETVEARAFIETQHHADDSRLNRSPPLCKQAGFAQEQDRWDILCLPKPRNKIRTAHSLGDKDTTVFISEFGELASFSKYLGLGAHGTVRVEPPILFPWYREEEFDDILDGTVPGLGLRLEDRKTYKDHRVDYIHDRWPRVSYKLRDLDIKIQFVVHQGIVAQQYVVLNATQEPKTCVFNLDLGFGAQPSTLEGYPPPFLHRDVFATAGGYAAMFWAGDDQHQVQIDVGLFQDGRPVKLSLSNHRAQVAARTHDQDVDLPEDVMESKTSPHHLHTVRLDPGVAQELTAVYLLTRHRSTIAQDQVFETGLDTEENSRLEGSQAALGSGADEPYLTRSEGELDEMLPMEGLESDIVSTKLDGTIHGGSSEDKKAQKASFWAYDGKEYPDDTVKPDVLADLRAELPNTHFLSPGPQYIDVSMFLKNNHYGKWTLKSTPTNQLLRRHLQQVLSVNSLSVPHENGSRSGIVLSDAHIMCDSVPSWGSLWMFRFLLYMYIFLERPGVVEDSLRDQLKSQIKDTCEKHLDWTYDIARPRDRGWAGTYHLDGSYSKHNECDSFYGALQFIKLYEFRMVFDAPNHQSFVLQKLRNRLGPWFESLEKLRDTKSKLWFSHLTDVNVAWLDPQYRQDEIVQLPVYIVTHLMTLWKAMSLVFQLLDESTNAKTMCELNTVRASLPTKWQTNFSPSRLRAKIMDYFTYDYLPDQRASGGHRMEAATQSGENHSNKGALDSVKDKEIFDLVRRKRVLAIYWAGNEKPRHLWQSSASPIFEAVDAGFFKSESSMRIWKNTLEAQRVHHELSWVKLTRYALALWAAQHGQSLDVTMNAAEMRKRVCKRLLESCYSNGTFPSEIDLTTKQPTSKWWKPVDSSGIFQIPLLLFQEEFKCLDMAQLAADPNNRSDLSPPQNTVLDRVGAMVNVSANCDTRDTNKPEDDLDFDAEAVAEERLRLLVSFKQSARSIKVDQANIQDPPEFEPDWLFPYPDCFASDEPTRGDDDPFDIHEHVKKGLGQLKLQVDKYADPAYAFIYPAIEKYLSMISDKESSFSFPRVSFGDALVLDVGQDSRYTVEPQILYYYIQDHLHYKRTVSEAKKRLTIIQSCRSEQASLLYLGSPESEKLSTAGFLMRHKMRENFMRDHAHKEVNLWVTELHFSFYKKVIINNENHSPKPLIEETTFEEPEKSSAFPGEPRTSAKRLQKGAIGWRFSGDLHDRWWTATVLAFVPDRAGNKEWITSEDLTIRGRYLSQRKVIEARLFSNMIKTIEVSTREILRDLETVLDEGQGGIYQGSTEHHDPFSESFDQSYSRSKLFLQLSDVLGHLDDSFQGIMDTIESYSDREKQRPVQPRWSLEDERQYRPELRNWDQQGRRNFALLQSLRSEVTTKRGRAQHLRESLHADMQLREARLQARTAEDVRLFTYVTIIFLPISFSASLFSMQQAPGSNVVGTFAKVAFVALVITLILLFNVKTMNKNMWKYIHTGLRKLSYNMSVSSWNFWRETREELAQAEKRNIQPDEPSQIQRTSNWWYFIFFLVFLLLELPAIRVLLAYDALFPTTEQDPNPPTLFKKVIRVLLGLLFFPLFAFVYTVLFLLGNIIDLLYQLYSSPGVYMRSRLHRIQASTDPSNETLSLQTSNVESEDIRWVNEDSMSSAETAASHDGGRNKAFAGLEQLSLSAQRERFGTRVARLTHPPRPFRSPLPASDIVGEAVRGKNDDQFSERERAEKPSAIGEGGRSTGMQGGQPSAVSSGTRIGRVLGKIGRKGSPKELPTARALPV